MDRCFLDKNWKGWKWSPTSLPRFIDISLKKLKKPKERKNVASMATQSMLQYRPRKGLGRCFLLSWRIASSQLSKIAIWLVCHEMDEMQQEMKSGWGEILRNPDLILPKESSPMRRLVNFSGLLPLSKKIHLGTILYGNFSTISVFVPLTKFTASLCFITFVIYAASLSVSSKLPLVEHAKVKPNMQTL